MDEHGCTEELVDFFILGFSFNKFQPTISLKRRTSKKTEEAFALGPPLIQAFICLAVLISSIGCIPPREEKHLRLKTPQKYESIISYIIYYIYILLRSVSSLYPHKNHLFLKHLSGTCSDVTSVKNLLQPKIEVIESEIPAHGF